MTSSPPDAVPTDDGPWRRTTSILSVSQVVTWGILYYSFAVYMPQMHDDLGWSIPAVSGGFAIATVVSGFAAPFVGRIIDRAGSRAVMTVGAFTGTAGLAIWAAAYDLAVFYLALAILGIAHATTLYAPAFATIVRHHPTNSRKAIVTVTLAGGLASTVFSPLAQALSERGTWRTGLTILAIGFALTVIPLNYSLPSDRHPSTPQLPGSTTPPPDERTSNQTSKRPASLWWIAAVWTLTAAVSTAFSIHIVAFLIDNGQGPAVAASIAGAAGIGKVGGRAIIAAGNRIISTSMLRASLAIQAVFLALPLLWAGTTAVVMMVVTFGATSGALTVLRPVLIAELFGTNGFASKNGEVQLITTVTKSSAPVLAGLAVGAFGYATTWGGLAAIVLAAIAVTYPIQQPTPGNETAANALAGSPFPGG